MALPNVSREAIIEAMVQWDEGGQRSSYNWQVNRYALSFGTQDVRLYPPKEIVALATGRGVDTFSGGRSGANRYLELRGFTVIDLAEVGREQMGL